MRISLGLLKKFVELPEISTVELRHLFDDIGLEVKGVEEAEGDTFFTIETLAHRGDHLGVIGMAREFSARLLTQIKWPTLVNELPSQNLQRRVSVETPLCARYALMSMTLPAGLKAPKEVTRYLDTFDEERPGIVHILNYVQKELGQPMHAFDRAKIEGEVKVVLSEAPEKITALDGQEYTVPAESLLIRDRVKTIAVAGVIGCANSCVDSETTQVLLESATFDQVAVRKTRTGMGISTDASAVFERGSDVEMVPTALKRVLALTGASGSVVKDAQSVHALAMSDVYHYPPEHKSFTIPLKRFKSAMNLPRLDEVTIVSRLKALGYQVKQEQKDLQVKVPSWRFWNVLYSSAVVEDFARIHGYNQVKGSLPDATVERQPKEPEESVLERVEPALLGNGFFEVITRSYFSQTEVSMLQELLSEEAAERFSANQISLNNSLEKGYSQLKQTNLVHLVRVLETYLKRGGEGAKIYEVGRVFQQTPEITETTYDHEYTVLSLASMGRWNANEWQKAEPIEDQVRAFTGVIQSVFAGIGVEVSLTSDESHPFLHPGRQASVQAGGVHCGFVGVVHPKLEKALDCSQPVLYAELYVPRLVGLLSDPSFAAVVDFPSIRRDITLKLPVDSYAGGVATRIAGMREPLLKGVALVDDFKKEAEDFRRVTYRMTFQSEERTLSHEEVDAATEVLLNRLKNKDRLEMVS